MYSVASAIPCRRHISAVFSPASASRKIPMICSSLYRPAFICPSPSGDELYVNSWDFSGGHGHTACLLCHSRVFLVPFRGPSQSRFLNLSAPYFSGFGSPQKTALQDWMPLCGTIKYGSTGRGGSDWSTVLHIGQKHAARTADSPFRYTEASLKGAARQYRGSHANRFRLRRRVRADFWYALRR